MQHTIIYITHLFPNASETFVVSNVIAAIRQGFNVKVVADRINPKQRWTQPHLFKSIDMSQLVVLYLQPFGKFNRLINGVAFLLNPIHLYFYIKYCLVSEKLSLTPVFTLKFYKAFRNANVFHVHFLNNSEEISILKKIGFLKSKLIVTVHGYDVHFRTNVEQQKLINKYKPFYEVWDKVTTNTHFLKEKVLRLGILGSKIQVVPMAIDLDFFKPKTASKTIQDKTVFNLVSVGRLIEVKGHEYGIRTIKALIELGFKVNYTIIGNGILIDKLNHLIKTLNLEKHVKLHGPATQETIKQILEQSHLYLMTSVKDSEGREETQGVVTAEAQALGLPIAGFDSGGVKYTVTDATSILVEQKNIEDLAKAIIEIVSDEKRYAKMSQNAIKWANSQFGLPKMIERYYNDVI